MVEAALVLIALLIGIGIGWFAWGQRQASTAADLGREIERRATAEAALATERRETSEKLALLESARKALSDAFEALAAQALNSNNKAFLELANQVFETHRVGAKADLEQRQVAISELVKPVKEGLDKFEAKIGELEKTRAGAYAGLTEQVRSLMDAQTQLRGETAKLAQALRSPNVRGRWGEIQLRRVVEMAGMLNHCDFFEQERVQSEAGQLQPDLVVRLPAGKSIVVDAKAPITSYLDAINVAGEEERKAKLVAYAKLIRGHVTALGKKAYWDQFDPTPELVVMFLPGEHFFGAALEFDPALIEFGVDQKVIIATPTTLIALLRAVAYGWRQEALAENAQEVASLGKQLYERIAILAEHWGGVGQRLDQAVEAYNASINSLETRVLVSARRFRDLKAGSESVEIQSVTPIDTTTRKLQAVLSPVPKSGKE